MPGTDAAGTLWPRTRSMQMFDHELHDRDSSGGGLTIMAVLLAVLVFGAFFFLGDRPAPESARIVVIEKMPKPASALALPGEVQAVPAPAERKGERSG